MSYSPKSQEKMVSRQWLFKTYDGWCGSILHPWKEKWEICPFGDNRKGRIIGKGKIKITPSTFIEDVLLIEKLKHNLLSISQLCDVGFNVFFKTLICIVIDPLDSSSKFIGHRLGNIYVVDLDDLALTSSISPVAMDEKSKKSSLLWHRRLGYASMHTIAKLISKDLV